MVTENIYQCILNIVGNQSCMLSRNFSQEGGNLNRVGGGGKTGNVMCPTSSPLENETLLCVHPVNFILWELGKRLIF